MTGLTERQLAVAEAAFSYPVILIGREQKMAARGCERKGWGTVDPGGDGEVIFRLNQAGCDALAQISVSVHAGGNTHA